MPCALSNSCGRARAASAKPFRMNWLSAFLVRITFTARLSTHRRLIACPVRRLRDFFGERVQELSLRDLAADKSARSFASWSDTFCVIQWAEIKSCLGAWIADAKPELGPDVAASFELANQLDRRYVAEALERREQYFRSLHDFLGLHDLLCIPTTPALSPRKGDAPARSSSGSGYYPRTSAMTSVGGIGRLPQVSLPVAHAGGVPVGLSLLARHGQGTLLLEVMKSLDQQQLC